MYAVRLQTVIPENRRLVVSLPADTPTGVAEIIILSTATQPAGNGAAILRFLTDRQWQPLNRLTAAELDRQVREEHEAWE